MFGEAVFFSFCVVIVFLIIWKSYWLIEKKINPKLFGPVTPDFFSISQDPLFGMMIKKGKEIAKNKKIIIASLLRDREESIEYVIDRIKDFLIHFSQVKVLIVENDSDDSTREKLLEYSKLFPGVIEVLGCGINKPVCKLGLPATFGHAIYKSRLEKMANLRNIYLDRIREICKITPYDYTLVWDMDTIGSLYIDGLMTSICMLENGIPKVDEDGNFSHFQKHTHNKTKNEGGEGKEDAFSSGVDALCANGVYVWLGVPVYYDTFAHKEEKFDWTKNIPGFFRHTIKSLSVGLGSEKVKKISSCFSGATVYKTPKLIKGTYETDGKTCEHDSISKDMNFYLNKFMVNYISVND